MTEQTRQQLAESKYTRSNTGHCSGCKRTIEWWTSPQGKRMPFDPMPAPWTKAVSHFATCPDAGKFRRGAPGTQRRNGEPDEQPSLFGGAE